MLHTSSVYPQFQHHGATRGVTGSCHRFIADESHHYLVDCGIFQGSDMNGQSALDANRIDFDIRLVKALVVTHVHIDHIGRLPYLIAAGFDGPIICSVPSAKLLPLVIEDALKVGFTRDRKLIENFLDKVHAMLHPLPYGHWFPLVSSDASNTVNVALRLQRAGHILGSAYVEFDTHYPNATAHQVSSYRTVFSGDLGAPHAPLLPAPVSPISADMVIIESTYGNREHEDRTLRKQRLKQAISHALTNGGTVIVPAFSIGRTQELLYELETLISEGDVEWQALEVVVDSPLAARFTAVYRELKPYWDDEAQAKLSEGRHPLNFENVYTVDSHETHMQTVRYLATSGKPAIVIAASGMAAGGRVVNYLKAMLEDARHAVLFVGYQAHGTLGHDIQKYGSTSSRKHKRYAGNDKGSGWVDIDGQRYTIQADVMTIGGYSAHADKNDLLRFIAEIPTLPGCVRIVHGDESAKAEFKQALYTLANERGCDIHVEVPKS